MFHCVFCFVRTPHYMTPSTMYLGIRKTVYSLTSLILRPIISHEKLFGSHETYYPPSKRTILPSIQGSYRGRIGGLYRGHKGSHKGRWQGSYAIQGSLIIQRSHKGVIQRLFSWSCFLGELPSKLYNKFHEAMVMVVPMFPDEIIGSDSDIFYILSWFPLPRFVGSWYKTTIRV